MADPEVQEHAAVTIDQLKRWLKQQRASPFLRSKQLLQSFSDALRDPGATLDRTGSHVLARRPGTFSNRERGIDWMQCDKVSCPFGGTFSYVACAFSCACSNRPGAAANLLAGPAVRPRRLNCCLFVFRLPIRSGLSPGRKGYH